MVSLIRLIILTFSINVYTHTQTQHPPTHTLVLWYESIFPLEPVFMTAQPWILQQYQDMPTIIGVGVQNEFPFNSRNFRLENDVPKLK